MGYEDEEEGWIDASYDAIMAHRFLQRHHIPPHELFKWSKRHRAFAFASEELAIEEEEKSRKDQENS